MASEALFAELAKALGQPSRASRAVTAAADVPLEAMKGYNTAAEFGDTIRKRKLGQQTLLEALGGQMPAGTEGYGSLTTEAAGTLAKPLEAIAAIDKANKEGRGKPEDFYDAAQTDAVASGDPTKLNVAFHGKTPRTAVAANTTARGVTGKNDFFGKRGGQIDLTQLPSELGPNTAAGAAYVVKVAARQGKSLVANPGSAQRISLGSGDIARAVLRAAPQLDALRGASFAENLMTRWSSLTQKLTADPDGTDAPKIRKEMYDILDDLDKSATPFIANHLANFDELLGTLSPAMRKRELGDTLPDIPFNAGGPAGAGNPEIEAAKQWLAANPNDPTAPAVRAKLQSHGAQ